MCRVQVELPLSQRDWQLANELWGENAGLMLGRWVDETSTPETGRIKIVEGFVAAVNDAYLYSGAFSGPGASSADIIQRILDNSEKINKYLKRILAGKLSDLAVQQNGRLFISESSFRPNELAVCIRDGAGELLSLYKRLALDEGQLISHTCSPWCILVRCGSDEVLDCICNRLEYQPPSRKELRAKFWSRLRSAVLRKVISIERATSLGNDCIEQSRGDNAEYRLTEIKTWPWLTAEFPDLSYNKDKDSELIVWMLKQEIPFKDRQKVIIGNSPEWKCICDCVKSAFLRAERVQSLLMAEITPHAFREIIELCGGSLRSASSLMIKDAVNSLKLIKDESPSPSIMDLVDAIRNWIRRCGLAGDHYKSSKMAGMSKSEENYSCPRCSSTRVAEDSRYCPDCHYETDFDD
jgi:hypothetical protein